jgi:membrane protein involved in colicin uptake
MEQNKQQNKQLFVMDEVIISVLLSIALMAYVVFGNIEKSK